jgi:hypothetical protein
LAADVLQDDERAQKIYQDLKFKLIGRLPHNGWTLTEDDVRTTIQQIEQRQDDRGTGTMGR